MKKPFRLASHWSVLRSRLSDKKCPGAHHHPVHAPCQGGDTKQSENYTSTFAQLEYNALDDEAILQAQPVGTAVVAVDPHPEMPIKITASTAKCLEFIVAGCCI